MSYKIGHVATALRLVVSFVFDLVRSGLATAWLIVKPGPPPTAGFVRLRFSGLSETGAALLGGMITLTPGTTTLHVDVARGEMLLHLLDLSDPARTARDIEQRFELPLRRLFPARGPR